ncbi:MAG: two component transcriptional regulator, LytTR family [Bacteroidetes bacterium]|jgi:two-component system LytT family response regulator|nr:two component transcriptional regulator, LytTR family [Bacteroidota bacterium]
MTKIRCIIVDDEEGNRSVLSRYLEKYCPEIEKLAEAASADEAFRLINETKPELVFLDIKMPSKSGFDLLRMFSKIDFDVIFISGFDEFAIQAFDFNAIDYILKPIDYQKLISSVKRAKERIELKSKQQNILHLVHSIDEKQELVKKMTLHHQGKVHFVDVQDIMQLEAIRGYCEITTSRGMKFVSTKTLKEHEDLLLNIPFFVRVNKSVIVNILHISSYSKGELCILTLKDKTEVEVSRRKKTEILEKIKSISGER